MRFVIVPVLALAACTVVGAAPQRVPLPDQPIELTANDAQSPPIFRDADADGVYSVMDCNDDNPLVSPNLAETPNGIDDNCDGIIDEGWDTTADWPAIKSAFLVWPDVKASDAEVALIDSPPRVVWTGTTFTAVWADRADRIRIARFDLEGKRLDDPPAIVRSEAKRPDVAWTGTRYGIVFEDVSGPRIWPSSDVRFVTLDAELHELSDVLVATDAGVPKIAWGKDRFGIVWSDGACAGDCLNFQRFDPSGLGLSAVESLPTSGSFSSIAFTGSAYRFDPVFERHEGVFAIVYPAYYGVAASGDVLATFRPLEPWDAAPIDQKVNAHADPYAPPGAYPSAAGNPAGVMVGWHVKEVEKDGACVRFLPVDGTGPVQEFAPDADLGRVSRAAWTGSEFVMVNDNWVEPGSAAFDVHLRRADSSANTHLPSGWGPWNEISFRDLAPGTSSVLPDVVRTGDGLGVVWIEMDDATADAGRIWFAFVAHR